MGDALSLDEVNDALRSHLDEMAASRAEWRRFRAAYATRFWADGIGARFFADRDDVDEALPIKVEVNQVYSFVSSHVANLQYRDPGVTARLPTAMGSKPGRRRDLSRLPDAMSSLGNEFLRRAEVRQDIKQAYHLALMYDASALKLTMRDAEDPIDRFAVQAIPRWEAVWDPLTVDAQRPAYIGHLRYERIDLARQLLGVPLDAEAVALDDYLIEDNGRRKGYRGYVRILEFYDLVGMEQRYYLVDGTTTSATARQVGETAPLPFVARRGMTGCPITPVVLSPTPEYPLMGISAVRRVYQINAEQNLILTILANAMRHDANTVWLYAKDRGLSEEALLKMRHALPGEQIGIDAGEVGDLSRIITQLPTAQLPPSLTAFVGLLVEARRDVQASSDMQQGRQGSYLSATEATQIAAYGELNNAILQTEMQAAVAKTLRLFAAGLAEERATVSALVGDDWMQLTPDDLELPWDLRVSDANGTPIREAQRKAEFAALRPALLETAMMASGKGPTPEGLPEPVVQLAQHSLDYMQQLYDLPENFAWGMLQAPREPSKAEVSQVRQSLGRVMDAQVAETGGVPVLPPNAADLMPGGELPMPDPEA